MSTKRVFKFIASIAVCCLFVALWQWVAQAQLIPAMYLPSPSNAWKSLVLGFERGGLLTMTLSTIERMFFGWLLASLAGIVLGSLIGISPIMRIYLEPTLELLRPLPASAIIPVAIAFLGLTDGMVLAVIAFGALWPMLLATIHGFSTIEPRLLEVSRALGLSKWNVIYKIALPNAMPDILSGMRLGLTIALILAVVGEMLSSRPGLGQWVLQAARSFRSPDLFAGVILLGVIGLLSALALSAIETKALRWRNSR